MCWLFEWWVLIYVDVLIDMCICVLYVWVFWFCVVDVVD